MNIALRDYLPDDESSLIALWNETMWCDPMDEARFREGILLDPNFVPSHLVVAEGNRDLVGFVLAATRRLAMFGDTVDPDRGWILGFGVAEEKRRMGIGTMLIQEICNRLAGEGKKTVQLCPYFPGFVLPGVDVSAYAAAGQLLRKEGWRVIERPLTMHVDLSTYQIPEAVRSRERELREQGFVFRSVQAYDIVPLLAFCLETFKWDWYRHMREALLEQYGTRPSNRTTVVLALHEDRIVGYAQQTGEHYGPFGVHPDYRGKGIGRVLCAKCLMESRKRGYHCAWFKWTGDYQAGVYAMTGFRETRRYEVMEKSLG